MGGQRSQLPECTGKHACACTFTVRVQLKLHSWGSPMVEGLSLFAAKCRGQQLAGRVSGARGRESEDVPISVRLEQMGHRTLESRLSNQKEILSLL